MHHRTARRFDPGLLEGQCQMCGANTSVPPGEPVPPHQPVNSPDRGMYPGAGTPAG